MGGGGEQPRGEPSRRNPTWGPSPIRPPYHIFRRGEEGVERRKGRGRPNPSPSFSLPPFLPPKVRPIWGAQQPLLAAVFPVLPHLAHIVARGCPEPLPVTRYVPGTTRTLLVSEYHCTIYESLPLDHFETPRHVRDIIQDSEQYSVTKSHNSYNTKSSSNVKRADPTGSRTM